MQADIIIKHPFLSFQTMDAIIQAYPREGQQIVDTN